MIKKVISVIIVITLFGFFSPSYYDINNVSDVKSIVCYQYLGEIKEKEYTDSVEIKEFIQQWKNVRLYPIRNSVLQESPNRTVIIEYNNGIKKQFNIVGIFVQMIMQEDNHSRKVKYYIVNPLIINSFF